MTIKSNRKSPLNQAPDYNWSKYIGLGTQLMVGLLLTLYIGKKMDTYFDKHAMFVWVAPSLFILVVLINVVRDTQNKK